MKSYIGYAALFTEDMVQCDKCGKETYMPFRCKYCGGYFCDEHRLPELHDCTGYYRYSRSTTGQESYRAPGYSYTPSRSNKIGFSQKELRDLAIGLAVIIAIPLFTRLGLLLSRPLLMLGFILVYGLAFILHEFAHKFMAQRLGYWAEFRLNQQGLLLTLLSFISPIKIIAPGAVMIGGVMRGDDYGKISIVGPLTNIGLGVIYLLILLFTRSSFVASLAWVGILINSSLALFNLIPFGVFDGAKIMKWNRAAWAGTFLSALALFIYTYL
jgi:Zn-dependent protease